MSLYGVHEQPHLYAGELVPLKTRKPTDAPPMLRIRDWADRVWGHPWSEHRSLVAWIYAQRTKHEDLPVDDQVVLGRVQGLPILIHASEVDWERM